MGTAKLWQKCGLPFAKFQGKGAGLENEKVKYCRGYLSSQIGLKHATEVSTPSLTELQHPVFQLLAIQAQAQIRRRWYVSDLSGRLRLRARLQLSELCQSAD